MSTPQRYARALVSGCLVTQSPLHIGNDASGNFPARIAQTRRQPAAATLRLEAADKERNGEPPGGAPDDLENTFIAVIVDTNGKPYVPASTLRGALRSLTPKQHCERLFGPEDIRSGAAGKAGIARLSDASLRDRAETTAANTPYWDEQRGTGIQHGIAINAVTGAVEQHMLYRLEFVPASSRFDFSALLLDASADELQAFVQALRQLDGGALGNGVAQGYGRIAVQDAACKVLTDDALKDWARSTDGALADCYTELPLASATDSRGKPGTFAFELVADSPVLVHQPGCDRDVAHSDGSGTTQAVVVNERDGDGRPRIPGTTLKGWARARARRILKTVHAGAHQLDAAASKACDALIDQQIATLFGTIGRRSRLYFSDAVAEASEQVHDQTFIAIDRFSGGVLDGALFRVWAAPASTSYRADLRFHQGTPWEDWQRGLLLWLLRDLVEGDLALGSGKGKGFGRLRLRAGFGDGNALHDWPSCLKWLQQQFGEEAPARWAAALDAHATALPVHATEPTP